MYWRYLCFKTRLCRLVYAPQRGQCAEELSWPGVVTIVGYAYVHCRALSSIHARELRAPAKAGVLQNSESIGGAPASLANSSLKIASAKSFDYSCPRQNRNRHQRIGSLSLGLGLGLVLRVRVGFRLRAVALLRLCRRGGVGGETLTRWVVGRWRGWTGRGAVVRASEEGASAVEFMMGGGMSKVGV